VRPAEIIRRAAGYLERHGVESPVPTAERLLSHVLRTDRAGLYSRDGLTSQEAKLFGRALCRRCAGEPLQHVTGEQGFRRLVLRVRPGVFVPRPETEVLVQAVLDALTPIAAPMVVDVATGSGAVALSIAHERPDATVFATDLSPDAVALARENADQLGLGVTVLEGDLLAPMPPELRGRLDAVVGNPPYVGLDARDTLPADVLAEPPMAVFGGIELYERLFAQASDWLRPGGIVAVEIEEDAAEIVSKAGRREGFEDLVVRRDLTGRDRVVTGRRPAHRV
jgi:release factor glutamine methyltransferase